MFFFPCMFIYVITPHDFLKGKIIFFIYILNILTNILHFLYQDSFIIPILQKYIKMNLNSGIKNKILYVWINVFLNKTKHHAIL